MTYTLLGTVMAGGLLAIYLLRAWPLINVVETGRTPEYPDVLPRRYRADPDRVFDAALHAINRLRKRFGRPPLVLGGRRGALLRRRLSGSVSLPPRRG